MKSMRAFLIAGIAMGLAGSVLAALPNKAANPNPANNATGVTTNNLRWAKEATATNGYRVYFNDSNTFRTNFTVNTTTNYIAGVLAPGTYTWRVDTTNVTGTTAGDVWSFTASLPDQTANPFPTNGTSSVTNATLVLRWTPVTNATGYAIYFNDSNTWRSNSVSYLTTNYSTGPLLPGATYTWRVDSSNQCISGVNTGAVWTFSMMSLPGTPVNPTPADGAANVGVDAKFSWSACSNAQSYNFWLDGLLKASLTDTNYIPYVGTLGTHTWRVEAVGIMGVATGATWTFTTRSYASNAGQWYVALDGDNSAGTNWATAFRTLDIPLKTATNSGDTVYVKYGTWQVGPEVAVTNLPGVTIRGGYAGNGAPGAFTNLPTIITCNSPATTNRLFYCRQSTVTFDRLSLTGGLAGLTNNALTPNYLACQGGAIWASNCTILVTNCILSQNTAWAPDTGATALSSMGGGIYAASGGTLSVADCQFLSNCVLGAVYMAKPYGGAIYVENGTTLNVRHSLFTGNFAGAHVNGAQGFMSSSYSTLTSAPKGGTIYSLSNNVTLADCVFFRNYDAALNRLRSVGDVWLAGGYAVNTARVSNCIMFQNSGFGLYLGYSAWFVTNCLMAANSMDGLYLFQPVTGNQIVNCTLADNGRYGVRSPYAYGSSTSISNCIMHGNQDGGYLLSEPTLNLTNVFSPEAFSGVNINDPLLVYGYNLSKAGLPGQSANSPCLDAGGATAASLGLDARATTTDGANDTGIVDVGWHYTTNDWLSASVIATVSAAAMSNAVLYVDAVNGSDANEGWIANAPVKTLTRAFGKAVNGSVINVASGTYDTVNGETFPLTITTPCTTVRGAGPSNTVLSGNGASRVMTVQGAGRVQLAGLTMQNGSDYHGAGGGLYVDATIPVISNCWFRNNRVTASPNGGSAYGGGVCINNTFEPSITDSLFVSNTVNGTGAVYGSGGGLCAIGFVSYNTLSVQCARVTFLGNSITNCSVSGAGVAIPNDSALFTFQSCTFTGNFGYFKSTYKKGYGGALEVDTVNGGLIKDCDFRNNWINLEGRAVDGNNIYGHGIFIGLNSSAMVAPLVLNSVTMDGNGWTNPVPANGVFYYSYAGSLGSPKYPLLANNCTFTHSVSNAGFFTAFNLSTGSLVNCTFANNDGWGANINLGLMSVSNCIAWGNQLGGITRTSTWTSVSYTDSQETQAGTSNLVANPLFVDPANGDYHLKSKGGSWHGGAWLADNANSPCIDAGDPADTRWQNEPAPNGGRLNLGFEGGTAQASLTPPSSHGTAIFVR